MPIEQALTPHDLSAMQILSVPDVWPPIDCPPTADLPYRQPAGLCDPGGSGRVEHAADGGRAWPRQFAVLLAEALTGERPVRQVLPCYPSAAACTCTGCCRSSAAAGGLGCSG